VYVNTALRIQHHDGSLGGKVLDSQALRNAIRSGTTHCCDVRTFQGQDYLVYSSPLRVQGKVVGAVQSSISEHQYEDTVESLRRALIIVALLGLIGAGAVSLVLVQRALRPIRTAVQRQRDFVADAAHELRTPLAIQRTVGEVGLAGDSGESSDATVEQMLAENKHLTRLVDDLSLLARADSHAISITPARMNLSSLVEDTASELEPLAEERGAHLTADVGSDIWVAGDVTRLRQLLLVLLDNALKFTPPGGTVRVRLQDGGGRAQLQVADSGPGIDPADLSRIFDRFYRSDKARTGEGSGLGLSIAKWIVDAHGGHIQAANAAPHGAVFTAILPTPRHARQTSA
jgi:signal transduction histidine kinase